MRTIRALKSLREHLPIGDVEEKFVNEYHSILTTAENQIGRVLDEHNIPSSEIKRRLVTHKFDDYGEVIDATYSDVRFCDRNFFIFKLDEAIAHLSSFNLEDQVAEQSPAMPLINAAQNTLNVFVVHGRNLDARNSLFRFLRSIGLRPLEWSQAITETGKASPFIGEILDVAFSKAQAVVVLLTPDDEARLSGPFRSPHDPPYESQLTGQARPNVLFEAGMAMGRNPDRTLIVELGTLRPFSDIAGRHTIRLSNDSAARQELAQRLQTAGCSVDLTGRDWHTEGDFSVQPSILRPDEAVSESTEITTTSAHESLGRHDQELAKLFLSEFPSQGKSVLFLRDHDLGSNFHFSELTEINNFLSSWDNAEHEFNNSELEKKRLALWGALKTFHRELNQHSSSTHREDWLSIGLEDMELRKEMLEIRDNLNELGTKAYEAHQELVREIKRRF